MGDFFFPPADTASTFSTDHTQAGSPERKIQAEDRPLSARRALVSSLSITCAVCLLAFPTVFALDSHAKKATHQAYKCKCGTDFNENSTLQRHINTKDAPKTFACNLCDDFFNRKDKLKDHCRHYHKVKDEGLRFLFNSQELKARPGASSRRRRVPVPLAAASSASAPTLAPGVPPAVAPSPAGPAIWSFAASTGQQYASFPAGPFIATGPLATSTPFIPTSLSGSAADLFTAALAPSEDIAGVAGDFLETRPGPRGLMASTSEHFQSSRAYYFHAFEFLCLFIP